MPISPRPLALIGFTIRVVLVDPGDIYLPDIRVNRDVALGPVVVGIVAEAGGEDGLLMQARRHPAEELRAAGLCVDNARDAHLDGVDACVIGSPTISPKPEAREARKEPGPLETPTLFVVTNEF